MDPNQVILISNACVCVCVCVCVLKKTGSVVQGLINKHIGHII